MAIDIVDRNQAVWYTGRVKKKDVIEYFGSGAATARALGLTRATISAWKDLVPMHRAYQLRELTGGELSFKISDYKDYRA